MHESIRNTPDTIIGGDVGMAKCNECFEWPTVEVLKTCGYFVGTTCKCGPCYSRETEYFKTRGEAEAIFPEVDGLVNDRLMLYATEQGQGQEYETYDDYEAAMSIYEQEAIEDLTDRIGGRRLVTDDQLDAFEERRRDVEKCGK